MRVGSAFALCVGCTAVPTPVPTSIAPHVAVHPESDVAADRAKAGGAARQIVVGWRYACGLHGDGRAACWGEHGTREVPDGTFVALSAGERHVCGLRSDRRAVCWGWDDYGQLRAPNDEFVALAADHWSSCGLRHDMMSVCWGSNDSGFVGVLPDRLRKLVNVHPHRCGLRSDGTIGCTPYGDTRMEFGDEIFADLALAGGLACGLRPDGTLRCEGYRDGAGVPTVELRSLTGGAGICGISTGGDAVCFGHDQKLPAAPPGPYKEVVSGRLFACGVRDDGELACWPPRPTPLPRGPFEQVAVGEDWVCARAADGRIACSGAIFGGQTVAPAGEFRALASGSAHSCGIRDDGRLECWGQNADGQADPPRGKYTAIACGALRSCAAGENGELECWGAPYKYDPPPALKVKAIAMGDHVDCAVLVDGGVKCWGQSLGKLDTSRVRDAVAIAVSQDELRVRHADGSGSCFVNEEPGGGGGGAIAPEWRPAPCGEKIGAAIAVNMMGGCTIDDAGAFRCTRGPSSMPLDRPVPASGGPFAALSMRGDHGCALARSGELACWGPDRFGEVEPPAGIFKAVALGDAHGCAIRDDDTLACWGSYAGRPL